MIFSPPFARILQPSNVFDNRNLISDLSIEDGGESSVRAGKGLKWRQATFRVSRNSFRTLHTLVEHNERVESMKSAHECDFQSAACELDYIILQQAALRGILAFFGFWYIVQFFAISLVCWSLALSQLSYVAEGILEWLCVAANDFLRIFANLFCCVWWHEESS